MAQAHRLLMTCMSIAARRCLDKFEGLSNKPISCAYLPHCNHWWATGRAGKLAALDPRAPAVITEYVAQPNQLQVGHTAVLKTTSKHSSSRVAYCMTCMDDALFYCLSTVKQL